MTAEPIRAALDAAAEAAREQMRASDSCLSEVCDSGPCGCASDAATAAVAAFLRALPAIYVAPTDDGGIAVTAKNLAAAVEGARDE